MRVLLSMRQGVVTPSPSLLFLPLLLQYYQWSPSHNENSAQHTVKAGDTLFGSMTYVPKVRRMGGCMGQARLLRCGRWDVGA